MKRILILTAILVFVAGMNTAILAQHGHGMMAPKADDGPGQWARGGKMGHCSILGCQKELELTDDQLAKIEDLKFAHQNAMIDLRAGLKKAELKMKQEAHADNPSKAAILTATKEITDIKGRIAEARVNHRFDLRAVLTAEQLEKWKDCQKQCVGDCGRGGRGFGGHRDFRGERNFRGNPGAPCDPADCVYHGDGPRDGTGRKGK